MAPDPEISVQDWTRSPDLCTLIERSVHSFCVCDAMQPNERPWNDPSQGSTAIKCRKSGYGVRISLTTRTEEPTTTLHRERLGVIG
jgi:hypothetical protein